MADNHDAYADGGADTTATTGPSAPPREDVLAMLGAAVEEAHRKVTNGRVRDAENEKVRQGWIRALAYACGQYRQLKRDEELEEMAQRLERIERRAGVGVAPDPDTAVGGNGTVEGAEAAVDADEAGAADADGDADVDAETVMSLTVNEWDALTDLAEPAERANFLAEVVADRSEWEDEDAEADELGADEVEVLATALGVDPEDVAAMPAELQSDWARKYAPDRQNAVDAAGGDPSGYGADMFTDGGQSKTLTAGTRSAWERSQADPSDPYGPASARARERERAAQSREQRANYAAIPGRFNRQVDDSEDYSHISAGTRSDYYGEDDGDTTISAGTRSDWEARHGDRGRGQASAGSAWMGSESIMQQRRNACRAKRDD